MSEGGLHVSSRKALTDSGVTVIDVKGDLADHTADEMVQALGRLMAAGRRKIVLNLGGTDMMTTHGVAQCVAVQKRLRERGGELKIAGATGDLRRVFDLLNLGKVLACYPEVRHAVEAFAKASSPRKKKK
jgi:anti-anti-sigma factor